MGETKTFKVGDWVVTPALNRLNINGRSVRIQPRTMDVLVYLANHAGEVISTEEFIAEVWQGRVVGDSAIYERIKGLRNAFGDDFHTAQFIETIPRRGYRLIAPVSIVPPEDSGTRWFPGQLPRRWKPATALLCGLVILVFFFYVLSPRSRAPTGGPIDTRAVAVLPFANLSSEEEDNYLGHGIAEEIIHALSNGSGLRVVAKTSSFNDRLASADIREIGDRLGVSVILEGSVRRENGNLRVVAQLVESESGYQLWSESFERPVEDLITVQREIAVSVARRLMGEGADVIRMTAALPPIEDIEAYEYYILGRQRMHNPSGVWGLWEKPEADRAIEYFRRAIAENSTFARAYTGLADALLLRDVIGRSFTDSHRVSRDVGAEAMAAIDKALAIDPELAEAHAARGLVLQLVEADSLAAIDAYRQAISVNPNLADAHYRLGRVISLRVFEQKYDFDAFAEEAETALEVAIALDPMSTENRRWLGILSLKIARNLAALGQPDEAIRKLRPAFIDQLGAHADIARFYLDLNAPHMAEQVFASVEDPNTGIFTRIHIALAQDQYEVAAALTHKTEPGVLPPLYEMVIGHDDHARGLYKQISAERPLASRKENFRWGYYPAINAAHLASEVGEDEAAAEMLSTARAALEEVIENKYTAGGGYYLLASISALEGNSDEALNMLEKAIASGWTRHWYARRDPNLEGLWNDTRFQSLINDVRNDMDRLRLELEPVVTFSSQRGSAGR